MVRHKGDSRILREYHEQYQDSLHVDLDEILRDIIQLNPNTI